MTALLRIEVEGLTLRRGVRLLLGGLTFCAAAGEAVAITGANGVGKTSLLRALAGFTRPVAGEIRFIGGAGLLDPDATRRERCHILGHADGLAGGRTVRDELIFAVRWAGGNAAAALDAAHRMGLERVLDLPVRHLSAGQKRRVALARLLAPPRALWLLDEPLAPLDAESRDHFGTIIAEHLSAGGLIIAAVHDPLPVPARNVTIAS